MNHLRRAFASTAKKMPYNGRKIQRTVSGLDPQHIASGSYLYKNFIKKQPPNKNLNPKKKKDIKKNVKSATEELTPEKIKKANKDIFLL